MISWRVYGLARSIRQPWYAAWIGQNITDSSSFPIGESNLLFTSRTISLMTDHTTNAAPDGEHEISKETCSDKQNPVPSPKLAHHETRSAPNDMPPISPSKPFAANPEHTSSIQNNHTTAASTTVRPTWPKTCRQVKRQSNGIQRVNVWIPRKCGSVGICGRMRRAEM